MVPPTIDRPHDDPPFAGIASCKRCRTLVVAGPGTHPQKPDLARDPDFADRLEACLFLGADAVRPQGFLPPSRPHRCPGPPP